MCAPITTPASFDVPIFTTNDGCLYEPVFTKYVLISPRPAFCANVSTCNLIHSAAFNPFSVRTSRSGKVDSVVKSAHIACGFNDDNNWFTCVGY
ncbi:MAG: hypothetical protein ACD_46C00658G0001 [uncultured bacterium]|nr:MAG: hypothetical protein ACD_46C00658G0001 [uncultured bacterium]